MLFSMLFSAVYEYEYNFSEPSFEQINGHMKIELPGCMQVGVEGEPLLPNFPIKIALPYGESLEKIEWVINKTKTYPLMLPLLPKQADRPLSWGISDKGFIKKDEVYRLDRYLTNKVSARVEWFRGVGILMGTIDPLNYFPAARNVELTESLTLKLTTKTNNTTSKLSISYAELLQDQIQNPDILSSYSVNIDQEIEKLLIITSNEFKPAFDTLIDHYKKYGIETNIISPLDMQSFGYVGIDEPDMIRNYILNTYLNDGLDYVLIGGNSSIIPHRGLYCSVLTGGYWDTDYNIPADLYYAALDGTWDQNGNGIFGEYNDTTGYDEADLLPELAIGRMPVANEEELMNMINKSILYQSQPIVEEMNKHTFFGEFLWGDPESWASDYLELLIGEHNDNGYTTQGLPSYLQINKWYDHDSLDYWSKETVKSELAEGTSFVHHDGHANTSYMMKFYEPQVHDSDFTSVNGIEHTTPVLYSHGCQCGGFDKMNCIGSRFVSGPYIYVGAVLNSRFGWFNEGTTEGPSIHLHREFENAIYELGFYPFGWALSVSKIATAPWVTAMGQHEQNALRWNYYTQNILGDPVMRIFTDTPSRVDVSYNIDDIGEGVLRAAISSNSDPVEGAGISVLNSSGDLIAFGHSNNSGNVDLTLSEEIASGDTITCWVSGENILLSDTTLVAVESGIDRSFSHVLLDNYPNPFNPSTTIEYSIPNNTEIDMRIFDVQGKMVKVLYQDHQTAGQHEINFDASDLSAGMYICRLQIADKFWTRKLVLLK
jgi:peptidase C25-like protein/type IX secretion system substrate protein